MGESLQAAAYGSLFGTFAPAIIAVALRFYAHSLTKLPLWYDDWVAVVSFVAAIGYDVTVLFLMQYGLGLHDEDLPIPVDQAERYLRLTQLIQEALYSVAIATAQLSLLGLYWRIFNASRAARSATVFLALMIFVWLMARLFVGIFQCNPPAFYWDKTIKGTCVINPANYFIGSIAAHTIIDVGLMILPATQIYRLQLSIRQKIGISLTFMFGVVVCLASVMIICRLKLKAPNTKVYENAKPPADMMYENMWASMWGGIEIHLSIMTCCLPMLRPIMNNISKFIDTRSSNRSGHTNHHETGQRTNWSSTKNQDANENDKESSTHELADIKSDEEPDWISTVTPWDAHPVPPNRSNGAENSSTQHRSTKSRSNNYEVKVMLSEQRK